MKVGLKTLAGVVLAAVCAACSCERTSSGPEKAVERMRTVTEYAVASGARLDTGFFMGIGAARPLKVMELVGKTPTDPWRGLAICTADGAPAAVELESRFPVTVRCGGEPRDMPEGRIVLSLPAKGSALVLTHLTQAEVGPRVDRTKFGVGACYGFPRTRPPSERDADRLVEGNADFCNIGHFGNREILAWLSKRGLICSVRDVSRWWGGDGDRAGKMREAWPLSRFDKLIDRLRQDDSQASLAMCDICDEPSALDMPYLGEAVAHWINRYPKVLPYVNLYPNYAKVSWTTGDQRVNQLGTTNYFAHLERYCQTVPLDYICFDHYPFDDEPERTMKREGGWYQNFEDAAYWCRKTGRDLWFIGQVNTKPKRTRWLSENNFRFQVNAALAYGAVSFEWATWQSAWWTNSVICADGTPSEHFEKVKRIDAELHRLAPDYMRYRNVATRLLNYPNRGNVRTFSNEVCADLGSEDGSKLVVGDMIARDGSGNRALYVFAADDMADVKRQFRTVRFRTSQTVRIMDGQGELPVSRAMDGSLSFRLRDCHGALVMFAMSGCRASEQRFDRSKLLVGAYCYRPCGSDEEHVRDIARCGVDFIIGVDVKAREVLDLFSKYHLGAVANGAVPGWWGGDGKNAGKMHVKCPRDAYERRLTEYVATLDHPAIWKIDLCDEPSTKDMPYIGETCELIARRVPQAQAYVNLYPNYAVASKNTGAEEVGQLGAKTYREYVETYCRTVPLDFISYDFYVYTQNRQRRPRLLAQMYDNFSIVAEACRRTGRSLWYVPQVNSHNAKDFEPTSENRLRFQAYTAMAYGAEAITWACWMPGWWTNNVYTADGRKTEQYEKLRKVNAEIHRFGPDYMAFRNTATHFVGFEPGAEMARIGVALLETLDAGCFRGVSTRERTPLLVGEMLPRGKDDGRRALFVVASGDPYDYAPAKRTVVFRLSDGRRVRILGTDGEIPARREGGSAWSFELDENSAALIVAFSGEGFQTAQPVWPTAFTNAMNAQMRFAASVIGREPATVRIASSDPYRLKINGNYVGYGPARGPKGHFRVDEWPLACTCETNRLEIDVAGYNAASYYFMQQAPFLEAEVCRGTNVLVATGTSGGFEASRTERVQKTIRYSGQRMFTEVYKFGRAEGAAPLALSVRPRVRHLPRIVPYPRFKLNSGLRVVARSKVTCDDRKPVRANRSADWMPGTDARTAFAKTELEVDSWRDAELLSFSGRQATDARDEKAFSLCGESVTVDAGLNDCGFPGMTVEVRKPGRVLFLFDEVLTEGTVDYDRLECVNVIEWMFDAPGRYAIESFEPYVFRYAEIAVPDGEVTISDLHIRTYKNPSAGRVSLKTEDRDVARIFESARETFAQNAVDVFTDCPSRERAGWLCDSYWIARSSQFFTGSLDMERLFLENYLLDEGHDVPKGMVPMCYPADHRTGRYIPNWAMWLVLELEDYVRRGGDRALVERFRPKMLAMKRFFDAYRNEDGLLERLPSWVFVEWSHANKLVQDVNYPSNMLWARALDGLAWLYGREDFADEAKRMRQTVGKQSWTGEWFCDNAVRGADGKLKLSGECTETCQYYAFFTGTADARTHSVLWKRLVEEFGPARRRKGLYPEIWPSNAFIGNYLRLELLAKSGLKDQLVREIKGYFLDMARQTGTLWEHDSTKASCSHGFASYVAVLLSGCLGG